ncbi:MAG: hypothetical protein ABSG18_12405 [Steroidobacteraceae bacterium]|jgi:hypothetical protein
MAAGHHDGAAVMTGELFARGVGIVLAVKAQVRRRAVVLNMKSS